MMKRKKNKSEDRPDPGPIGLSQAAEELSVAVEEFDRRAASWSAKASKGDLALTR
jgi:hypothetical protein